MNNNSFTLLFKNLSGKFGLQRFKENELLSKHTTFRIGGPARLYLEVREIPELEYTMTQVRNYSVPFFVLGGGTNLVVSDNGFNGLVIKNNINKINIKKYGGSYLKHKMQNATVEIESTSGVPMNQLVRFTLDENLSGIEAFLGQPGTVGGAMYINAHNMKMNEFFGDRITKAKILTVDGEIKEVSKAYFKFGYDYSILQEKKDIVISVALNLLKSEHDKIWDKANRAMEHRKKSQPLGIGSSGCTFRNISKSDALRIGTPNGTTSAGYLLEAVGLKNYQIGKAKFSEKHANFIVNLGGATSVDVQQLIDLAKERVQKRFRVLLKEEVVHIG